MTKPDNLSPRAESTAPTPVASVASIIFRRDVVGRSLRVALLVGTILVLINQGDALLSLSLTRGHAVKMALTYLVPYAVTTYASVSTICARHSGRAPNRP